VALASDQNSEVGLGWRSHGSAISRCQAAGASAAMTNPGRKLPLSNTASSRSRSSPYSGTTPPSS
jgi:hypothetical protein